jgi:hypothetical protein
MCFVDLDTKKEYPVDFFNVHDWIKYRFSPCIEPPLPALNPQPSSALGGILGSFSSTFPRSVSDVVESLPFVGRKGKMVTLNSPTDSNSSRSSPPGSPPSGRPHIETAGIEPQIGHQQDDPSTPRPGTSPATAVTVSRPDALKYLTRTLAAVKQFKTELSHNPSLAKSNSYPPFTVIYGKSEPTVFRARVRGRDGIGRADAYENLAFASGDGVVLARAAMLPDGYKAVRGGVVASERGHVTLLGDFEAVGRCLVAVIGARKKGVGFGAYDDKEQLP